MVSKSPTTVSDAFHDLREKKIVVHSIRISCTPRGSSWCRQISIELQDWTCFYIPQLYNRVNWPLNRRRRWWWWSASSAHMVSIEERTTSRPLCSTGMFIAHAHDTLWSSVEYPRMIRAEERLLIESLTSKYRKYRGRWSSIILHMQSVVFK